MHRLFNPIFILLILLSLAQCKKEDDDSPTPANPSKSSHTTMDGSEGIFYATKAYPIIYDYSTTPMTIKIVKYGTVRAYLYDGPYPNNNFMSAGDVYCNKTKLVPDPHHAGGVYSSDTNNIDFKQEILWDVKGSSEIKGFSFKDSVGFPYMGDIRCDDTLRDNEDFTIYFDSLRKVDSILITFMNINMTICCNKDSITIDNKLIDYPNLNPGEFSHTEIKVTPFLHFTQTINDKKYYFRNYFARHKMIYIIGE